MQEHIGKCAWEKDYTRYIQLNRWLDENTEKYTKKQEYELNNCVTRYFVSMSLLSSNKEDETVYQKFLQELKDKGLKIVSDLRKFESITNSIDIPQTFDVSISTEYVNFTCGLFSGKFQRDRYEILRAMSEDEDILCMLLRYTTFSYGSFSWQVPLEVYRRLYEKHGLTLEGCASPLNSQIQSLQPFKGRYCSAFKEDDVFGSIGNIFDISFEGEVVLINPPFVEDFMIVLSDKVHNQLIGAIEPTTIIFVAPMWIDSLFHTSLSESQYLKAKYDLLKGQYTYEHSLSGEKFNALFNSTVFVLSNREICISDAISIWNHNPNIKNKSNK